MLNTRHVSSVIPCLVLSFATCFAQTPATFHTQSYTERLSFSSYAVDVNNDGVLDLVQFQAKPNAFQSATGFTVRVANGDGSFRAPVVYPFSPPLQSPGLISSDFNGDGNVDLIFNPNGGNQFTLYLGNGDGTFQAPKVVTVALPSGQQFGSSLLTADFTGDGKLDLVANTFSTSTSSFYLIPGNGTGNFGTPALLYTSPANNSIGSYVAAGDFDGDGRADVAFLDHYNCDKGNCFNALHVLYNEGNSQFTDTTVLSSLANELSFSAGDLNSDGRTDIFGVTSADNDPANQLEVLYGQADRTFHTYTPAVPMLNTLPLAMADFNGDTRMDLVGIPAAAVPGDEILFLLADGGEGTFTPQTGGLPASGSGGAPIVGDFNSDTRPDALTLVEGTITTTVIADLLNTTADGNWGGCDYPKAGMGIHVCAPGSSTASPVTFNASANSFGQLRKMELWVDGKKIAEQHHTWGSRAWFDLPGTTFSSGTHSGVMFAADIDNRLQKTAFNFNIGGAACIAPSTAGVNICSPASGSTVSSPVQVQAVVKVNGTIAHMQLWVDGVKKYTVASTTLNTSLSLAVGTHRFAVVATNTAGQKWESAVNATVK